MGRCPCIYVYVELGVYKIRSVEYKVLRFVRKFEILCKYFALMFFKFRDAKREGKIKANREPK